jgi:hypothetical protein
MKISKTNKKKTASFDLSYEGTKLKKAVALKLGFREGGWKLSNTASVIKYSGASGLGIAVGVGLSYSW